MNQVPRMQWGRKLAFVWKFIKQQFIVESKFLFLCMENNNTFVNVGGVKLHTATHLAYLRLIENL